MASPRIRRLQLDAETIRTRLAGWPLIQISGSAGMPPEIYRFNYSIRGLYVDPTGNIVERESHILEVNLSLGYPRRAPQCRMLTPVFHPNFDDASVCIGDFWAASEGLDDLIIRIGRMIAYQEYNIKSPLNGLAAKWAEQNAHLLPIDTRVIAPPLPGESPSAPISAPATSSSPALDAGAPVQPEAETPVPVGHAAADPPPPPPAPPVSRPASDSGTDPWSEKIVIEA